MKKLSTFTVLILAAVVDQASAEPAGPCPSRPVWMDMPKTVPAHERLEILDIEGVAVGVLLPPGYAQSTRRYPAIYLNHGGLSYYGEWLTLDTIDFTASLPDDEQAIVVMSDGGYSASTDINPGPSAWETFHTRTLIDAIDARYRTIADRSRRA
ncbi:MAG: esterase family protein, partial [Actinobacteria bacterium]|nr:esterase family protein [Actinomycetota bacterium]